VKGNYEISWMKLHNWISWVAIQPQLWLLNKLPRDEVWSCHCYVSFKLRWVWGHWSGIKNRNRWISNWQ
jgi:hypothetical protein